MTLFHGKNSRKDDFSAGFSVWVSLVLLVVGSALLLAFVNFEQMRARSIEKRSSEFYSTLENENSCVNSDWKNGGNHEVH